MSIGKLNALAVSGQQELTLTWDDDWRAAVDLAGLIRGYKGLAALVEPNIFANANLSEDGWSVEWPGGEDLGAAQLRRLADEQAGNIMPPAQFRQWIDNHSFTLEQAANALGLSRRTIAYYLSGEQIVPKTVLLATVGYDYRKAA